MKTIKIKFTDFYNPDNSDFISNVLSKKFNLLFDNEPDFVIYSDYGYDYLKYKNAIRIYYTGENLVPDFNLCDYAIGFHHLKFEDRYLRLPLCVIREPYRNLLNKAFDKETVVKRKFCNFVFSNAGNAHPLRNKFFHELSKYKKVDAGGKIFNNIGGPVPDKMKFIADYKFSIAIENSSVNGYVTEKIVEPMSVNSIPIYWGSDTVDKDFNIRSFIRIENESDEAIQKAIEQIIYLDNNDEAYLQKLSEPWLSKDQFVNFEQVLLNFLTFIVEQPIAKSRRIAMNGFNMRHVERYEKMVNCIQRSYDDIGIRDIIRIVKNKIIK
jgi:hypothetical protein